MAMFVYGIGPRRLYYLRIVLFIKYKNLFDLFDASTSVCVSPVSYSMTIARDFQKDNCSPIFSRRCLVYYLISMFFVIFFIKILTFKNLKKKEKLIFIIILYLRIEVEILRRNFQRSNIILLVTGFQNTSASIKVFIKYKSEIGKNQSQKH